MNILKKLSGLFSASSEADQSTYWVTVRCLRCGETIRTRLNLNNDLSAVYDEAAGGAYFCHKILTGEGSAERRCFQRIEIELTFDGERRLLHREISGGQFVD